MFDLDQLAVSEPRLVNDLPLGHQRWTQEVEGYKLTLVSGVATFREGLPTGNLPGTLVRNPRADASAYAGVAYRVSAPFDGEVPEFEDNGGVLEGLGEKGGSAAGRLLRETVESKSASVAAKL